MKGNEISYNDFIIIFKEDMKNTFISAHIKEFNESMRLLYEIYCEELKVKKNEKMQEL